MHLALTHRGVGFTPGDEPVDKSKSRNKVYQQQSQGLLADAFVASFREILADIH